MVNPTLKYSSIGLLSLLLFACSSKPKNVPHIQYEEINEVMDTIVAKREFEPMSSAEIIPKVTKLISGKVKLALPKFQDSDSTELEDYLQALAISSTYASWGKELNQHKIEDEAVQRSAYLLDKLGEVELSKGISDSEDADTVSQYVNEYLSADSLEYLSAYYEAVSWLENLYITVNFNDQIKNKTEFRVLINSQLLKGDDLLEYLYDYQDYQPISEFSIAMLDIIECRNYELDVTELKQLIIALRLNNYLSNVE